MIGNMGPSACDTVHPHSAASAMHTSHSPADIESILSRDRRRQVSALVGGWWRLVAVGGWRLAAVGGGWRLAVGGWWSLGAVLKGCA